MNSWLKLALYSFIGIVIGSFLLGIIAPGYNGGMNMDISPGQVQMNGMPGGMGMSNGSHM